MGDLEQGRVRGRGLTWWRRHIAPKRHRVGGDNNDGRELPAEAFCAPNGEKDDSSPSPQSVHRPRRRGLRRRKFFESLLSLILKSDIDGELVEMEFSSITQTKNVSKDKSLLTETKREINTMAPALTDSLLYNDLSEQEQLILRQHISESSLPQMKTPLATDIHTWIILWEMKESFKKVPLGYAYTNGKFIPSQEDKEELRGTKRSFRARKEEWTKQRIDSVRLPTILERIENEESEAMEGFGIGDGPMES